VLTVLRQRNFVLLWVAGLVSTIGDMVLFIALPFYVFDLTHSTLATGTILIAETIPRILFGSVAGVFVDRWDRRRTLVSADLLRAALLLPLLGFHSADTLWLVYAVGFVQSAIGQFFRPAKGALIPNLVAADDLTAANALNAQADASTTLLGPLAGGAVFTLFGLPGVIWIDSASFLGSAILIALIAQAARAAASPAREPASDPTVPANWQAIIGEWQDGLRLVRESPLLIALFAVTGCVVLADGVTNALFVPLVKEVMQVTPLQFSYLFSATGAGRIIGLTLIGRYGRHLEPYQLMALGSVAAGALFFVLVHVNSYWIILPTLVVLVGPIPGINVGIDTLIQTTVTDAYRGRIFGALGAILGLVTLLGMVFSSTTGNLLGVGTLVDLAAAGYLAAGLVALVALRGKTPETVGQDAVELART
jgi:MFS family permease